MKMPLHNSIATDVSWPARFYVKVFLYPLPLRFNLQIGLQLNLAFLIKHTHSSKSVYGATALLWSMVYLIVSEFEYRFVDSTKRPFAS